MRARKRGGLVLTGWSGRSLNGVSKPREKNKKKRVERFGKGG